MKGSKPPRAPHLLYLIIQFDFSDFSILYVTNGTVSVCVCVRVCLHSRMGHKHMYINKHTILRAFTSFPLCYDKQTYILAIGLNLSHTIAIYYSAVIFLIRVFEQIVMLYNN